MLPILLRTFFISALLLLVACSTAPRGDQPAKTPNVSPQPAPKAAKPHVEKSDNASVKKVFCPPEPTPTLNAGEYAVWIDSEPEGGIVVIDGTPVGRTPQRIVLNGTARGFCHDNVSIKVRFVATDSDHTSQTVEELFTPLDKIPARVRFTTQGATRVAR